MTKKLLSLLILTLFLFSVIAVTVSAKSRIVDERTEKLSHYGFMFDKKAELIGTHDNIQSSKLTPRQNLGITGDGNTPGVVVAHTWYDYQCNSSTSRQIDWRASNPQIHMAYTQIFAVGGIRYVSYNIYDPVSGTWPKTADVGCPVSPPQGAADGRAGFTCMDVRPDGAAVVACHHSEAAAPALQDFSTAVYVDQTASVGVYCGFGNGSHASNDLAEYAALEPYPAEFAWPRVEYHINGNDTVIYALSVESPDNTNLEQAMIFFRNVGSNLQGTWEATPIDTVFFPLHNLASSRVSTKVAICYLDRAPEDVQGNNDVYYLVSDDMGETWDLNNKINVTNYQPDEEGYRAWLELSCLYDSNDHLHLVWNANIYNGDGANAVGRSCRLFHWAEHTDVISTIQNAEWSSARICGVAGVNVFNVAKFTISECNGRLYVIWNQWGNPDAGDTTDCADPDLAGAGVGANAEIYLSVSSTLDGTLWDAARNLTNTKTPGCDSTTGNECANETWPFMSRFGMDTSQFTSLQWSAVENAYEVDPTPGGSYTGNHFLDILYVNDVIPGPSENTGGTGTKTPDYNVPIRWFRLPCVAPVVEPRLLISPINIFYPEYTRHGDPAPYNIIVENAGNAELNISSIYTEKDSYSSDNWLAVDQTSMTVASGAPNNIDTLVVTLNNGGVINEPGTVVNLVGRVGMIWTRQAGIDTTFLPIDFYVADTVAGLAWDTVSTNIINLIVSRNGNMGNSNIGFVNMDFFRSGLDCDDSSNFASNTDTIPGDASVYLGNACPVILTGEVVGVDTTVTASWGMFNYALANPNVFKPINGEAAGGVKLTNMTDYTDAVIGYHAVHTGSFVTVDSNLVVEKTYYAPTADVSYIVQMMRIFSYDGDAHSGLVIGEAYDWDIPSDTGSYNGSGTEPTADLIYMLGGEFNEPHGDSLECTDNDSRAGGAVRAGYYTQAEFNSNPTLVHTDPIWGGYVELNEDFVYPANDFVPNEIYGNMLNNPGLNAQASSVNNEDMHLVMTHFDNYSLGATDTLIIWTVMATVPPTLAKDAVTDLVAEIDAGKAWLTANLAELKLAFTGCCIGETGNADCSAVEDPDISDITRLISFLYLQGPELCCVAEADVDNSGGSAPTTDDVDISDITYLIAHLYLDGRALKPCP